MSPLFRCWEKDFWFGRIVQWTDQQNVAFFVPTLVEWKEEREQGRQEKGVLLS